MDAEGEIWYGGPIAKQQCDGLLNAAEHGKFMVRESASTPGNYTLAANINGQVTNFPITRVNGSFSIGGQDTYPTMCLLINTLLANGLSAVTGLVQLSPYPIQGAGASTSPQSQLSSPPPLPMGSHPSFSGGARPPPLPTTPRPQSRESAAPPPLPTTPRPQLSTEPAPTAKASSAYHMDLAAQQGSPSALAQAPFTPASDPLAESTSSFANPIGSAVQLDNPEDYTNMEEVHKFEKRKSQGYTPMQVTPQGLMMSGLVPAVPSAESRPPLPVPSQPVVPAIAQAPNTYGKLDGEGGPDPDDYYGQVGGPTPDQEDYYGTIPDVPSSGQQQQPYQQSPSQQPQADDYYGTIPDVPGGQASEPLYGQIDDPIDTANPPQLQPPNVYPGLGTPQLQPPTVYPGAGTPQLEVPTLYPGQQRAAMPLPAAQTPSVADTADDFYGEIVQPQIVSSQQQQQQQVSRVEAFDGFGDLYSQLPPVDASSAAGLDDDGGPPPLPDKAPRSFSRSESRESLYTKVPSGTNTAAAAAPMLTEQDTYSALPPAQQQLLSGFAAQQQQQAAGFAGDDMYGNAESIALHEQGVVVDEEYDVDAGGVATVDFGIPLTMSQQLADNQPQQQQQQQSGASQDEVLYDDVDVPVVGGNDLYEAIDGPNGVAAAAAAPPSVPQLTKPIVYVDDEEDANVTANQLAGVEAGGPPPTPKPYQKRLPSTVCASVDGGFLFVALALCLVAMVITTGNHRPSTRLLALFGVSTAFLALAFVAKLINVLYDANMAPCCSPTIAESTPLTTLVTSSIAAAALLALAILFILEIAAGAIAAMIIGSLCIIIVLLIVRFIPRSRAWINRVWDTHTNGNALDDLPWLIVLVLLSTADLVLCAVVVTQGPFASYVPQQLFVVALIFSILAALVMYCVFLDNINLFTLSSSGFGYWIKTSRRVWLWIFNAVIGLAMLVGLIVNATDPNEDDPTIVLPIIVVVLAIGQVLVTHFALGRKQGDPMADLDGQPGGLEVGMTMNPISSRNASVAGIVPEAGMSPMLAWGDAAQQAHPSVSAGSQRPPVPLPGDAQGRHFTLSGVDNGAISTDTTGAAVSLGQVGGETAVDPSLSLQGNDDEELYEQV
eukprot:m.306057 g.306057  ORF g.306057 m.306057 type:complete len:1112 (+) comp15915_c1_seq1:222-3557(+)